MNEGNEHKRRKKDAQGGQQSRRPASNDIADERRRGEHRPRRKLPNRDGIQ